MLQLAAPAGLTPAAAQLLLTFNIQSTGRSCYTAFANVDAMPVRSELSMAMKDSCILKALTDAQPYIMSDQDCGKKRICLLTCSMH